MTYLGLTVAPSFGGWLTHMFSWHAVFFINIPVGLTAYPAALAIRFTLAAGLAYSVFFAISAGSPRTAAYILAGLTALIVANNVFGLVPGVDLVSVILERLYDWPGPLGIFGGRWMLIDV